MTDHLEELSSKWKEAKRREQEANALRISIESDIYSLVCGTLPDKGTTTLATGMKIVTGYSESWDQAALNSAYEIWPSNVPFPFKGEWKADGKAINYVRKHLPEDYALIRSALTLTPKKPAFSVKE
jgi:hypothetical protein